MGSTFGDNIKISNRTILSTKISPSSKHCTKLLLFFMILKYCSGQPKCSNCNPEAGGIILILDSQFLLREQMACCMVDNTWLCRKQFKNLAAISSQMYTVYAPANCP